MKVFFELLRCTFYNAYIARLSESEECRSFFHLLLAAIFAASQRLRSCTYPYKPRFSQKPRNKATLFFLDFIGKRKALGFILCVIFTSIFLGARCELSYLNGWKVKIEFLVNESIKDGRTAIASALTELEEHGYLTRQRVQDSENHFTTWESVIRETPDEEAATLYKEKLEKRKARKSGFPKIRFPENQVSRKSENPTVGFSDRRETAYIINTDSDQISKDQILTPPPLSRVGI